jgi:hypothetical protein
MTIVCGQVMYGVHPQSTQATDGVWPALVADKEVKLGMARASDADAC